MRRWAGARDAREVEAVAHRLDVLDSQLRDESGEISRIDDEIRRLDEQVSALQDEYKRRSGRRQVDQESWGRAEQALLNLLARVHDMQIRQHLCRALLVSGSQEGIPWARRLIETGPLDPAMLDLRQELLAAAEMMGADFPERDAWQEDAKGDEETRRQFYTREVPVVDNYTDLMQRRRQAETRGSFLPAPTSLMFRERVGRNDPCPCGSGKKYKKCCMRK